MMKKLTIGALLVAMAVVMAAPAQAAFTVGGENGWSLSTDGIVDIFGTYTMSEKLPDGARFSLLNGGGNADQEFGVMVGLLPSIVALNVKAPTVAGVDSNVRVAIYPSLQSGNTRFNTSPNVDFREFFYTASGKFGQILAGRALNLFQGQNILNDMTLFTAGVVPKTHTTTTTLGHIAYGYLYTNFGPQFRYTTPDMGGVKVAIEIAEPYQISDVSAKRNIPRIEAEISYAKKFSNGSIHAWLEGLWQQDTRNSTPASVRTVTAVSAIPFPGPPPGFLTYQYDVPVAGTARPGGHNTSLGIAPGFNLGIGPVGISASGYYGRGLGIVSAQDGNIFGGVSVDSSGKERHQWGFLTGVTYQVTDAVRLGANYGRCDVESNDNDPDYTGLKKTQEAAVAQINYNLNKFTQFTLEYIWARDKWFGIHDDLNSHQFALGTVFFW